MYTNTTYNPMRNARNYMLMYHDWFMIDKKTENYMLYLAWKDRYNILACIT